MTVVRPATMADAEAICGLENECFSHPWSLNSIREELENENAFLFVACEKGESVGYAGVQIAADEGYILNVAVTASARRKGVGKSLLSEVKKLAQEKQLAFLTLELRESNAPAKALYTALGYTVVGRRRGYYDDPKEDAVLMTLNFGEII